MQGLQAAAGNEPLHGIQQFEPILQRRMGHAFPLVKTLRAVGEQPLTPDALRIDLKLRAVLGNPFPTDFGFRHVR